MYPVDSPISECLSGFEPIGLAATNEQAGLLKRVDTKYVVRPDQFLQLLPEWQASHRLLEIDRRRIFHYQSVYYDTPGLALYHAHHAGAGNRVKFRVRAYTDSDLSYYEVKSRSNNGITDKQRTRLRDEQRIPDLLAQDRPAHGRHLGSELLQEALQVDYDRITLVSKNGGERITIDLNLTYRLNEKEVSFPDRVIVEVKHARGSRTVERDRFRRIGVRAGSISKYCLGIISLYPHVKYNQFKPSLRILAKQLTANGSAASFT
jgi:hypothetical protein